MKKQKPKKTSFVNSTASECTKYDQKPTTLRTCDTLKEICVKTCKAQNKIQNI